MPKEPSARPFSCGLLKAGKVFVSSFVQTYKGSWRDMMRLPHPEGYPPSEWGAWFRMGHFRVTGQGAAGRARRGSGREARGTAIAQAARSAGSGGAAEALVAEHLQPVAVLLAAE